MTHTQNLRNFMTLIFSGVCVFMVATVAVEAASPAAKQTVDVVAHRGFSGIAPENTLAAMRKAVERGATGCECDVYSTKDGVLVLSHDASFKRMSGVDLKVREATIAQVKALDVSGKFSQYKGERVPTFEEYLKYMKTTDCRPVIELKMKGIEQRVVDLIRQYRMEKQVYIIAFDPEVTATVRQIAPELKVAWLASYKKDEVTEDEIIKKVLDTLKKLDVRRVDINYRNITPAFMKAMRDAGYGVWAWTVDNEDDIKSMLELGVDSITTNYPDRVLKQLKSK